MSELQIKAEFLSLNPSHNAKKSEATDDTIQLFPYKYWTSTESTSMRLSKHNSIFLYSILVVGIKTGVKLMLISKDFPRMHLPSFDIIMLPINLKGNTISVKSLNKKLAELCKEKLIGAKEKK